MPYTFSQGVRIRYEVEGKGSPLLLLHGATVGLEMWQELGYTEALRTEYLLVLMDARGHGQSDKPHDPGAYRPELMAGDVVAVLDALGIEQVHYLGASMGAAVGFEMARHAPHRLRSLALLGYGRFGQWTDAQREFVTRGLQMFRAGAELGGAALVAMIEKQGASLPEVTRAAYLANDWQALLAFQTAFVTWPGFEEVLPQIGLPSLLLATEGDPFYPSARQCASMMPGASFVALAEGHHSQNDYAPAVVLPHLRPFLDRVDPGVAGISVN